ncbi:Heterokaryon incompatibility protein (HET) domain containing protein [Rhypophila decipiens]
MPLSSPPATPLRGARLCTRCQVLEFDDRKAGGSVGIAETGKKYLRMPNSERVRNWEEWTLPLNFQLRDHLPVLPVLEKSAKGGCEFCAMLRDTMLHRSVEGAVMWEAGVSGFFSQTAECIVGLQWVWSGTDMERLGAGGMALRVSVMTPADRNELVIAFQTDAADGHNTLANWLRIRIFPRILDWADPRVIAWGRSMVDVCVRDHSHIAGSFIPKRLIFVQDQHMKLVQARDIGLPHVNYAALSYCWGSTEESKAQLRTDSAKTESRFLNGIQEQELPPVVRDAVITARLLGIPYLWVDAICIRQDAETGGDWEEHAGIMDQIYGNAWVTIGAISSTSCLEGFLRPRENELELYVNYRSTLQPQASGLLRLRLNQFIKDTRYWSRIQGDPFDLNLELSKWISRGWTYQEMVASTRLLAFGRMDVLFSCPKSNWYLGGPEKGSKWWGQTGLDWRRRNNLSGWLDTISFYGQRNRGFSYTTDIFPALSGLARAFGSASNLPDSDYVAGMWKPTLLMTLCWKLTSRFIHADFNSLLDSIVSPQPYVCPSWSWANRGQFSTVLGWSVQIMPYYRQLDTYVTHKGKDPLGQITHAHLRVVGKVVSLPFAQLQIIEDTKTLRQFRPWSLDAHKGQWHLFLDWAPAGDTEDRVNLKMLLLGSFSKDGGLEKGFVGLLLYLTPACDGERLYRVGVFCSAEMSPQTEECVKEFFDGPDECVEIF